VTRVIFSTTLFSCFFDWSLSRTGGNAGGLCIPS
jgi:hypothetical protein